MKKESPPICTAGIVECSNNTKHVQHDSEFATTFQVTQGKIIFLLPKGLSTFLRAGTVTG